MTGVDIKALDLLGKEISFDVILPNKLKEIFPDGISITGTVDSVLVNLVGIDEILVCDQFYSLNEIKIIKPEPIDILSIL